MGSGIALQFKNMYPQVYESYLAFIKNNGSSPLGHIDIVPINKDLFVVNAFTQDRYGRDANIRYTSYDAVDDCFNQIASNYKVSFKPEDNMPIKIPLIGAGRGNGNWNIIVNIIKTNLDGVLDPDLIELFVIKGSEPT